MRECWSYSYNLRNTRSYHSSLRVVYSLKLTSEQDSQTLLTMDTWWSYKFPTDGVVLLITWNTWSRKNKIDL